MSKDNSYISIVQIDSTDISNKYKQIIVNPSFPDLPQINANNLRVFIIGGPPLQYGRDYMLIEPNIISWNSLLLDNRVGFNQPQTTPTAISEDDYLAILYTEKGTFNVSKSQTFTLADTDILNGYVMLNDTPRDIDDVHIEVQGAPGQEYYYDYQADSSNYRKISFLNLRDELNKDHYEPAVNDTITITYATDELIARRIRENHEITDVDIENGRIFLQDTVLNEASVHAKISSAPFQIRGIDFTAHNRELIWEGYTLGGELSGNLSGNRDYLEVVYHTNIGQLPIKTVVEYANENRQGLCPRLKSYVRDLEYSQKYEVPSENAIRKKITDINTEISFINGPSANTYSIYDPEQVNYIGIFGELSSTTQTLSGYKYNPVTHQIDRLISWQRLREKAFFKPIELSGENFTLVDENDLLLLYAQGETDLLVDSPDFVRTPIQGGNYQQSFVINENEIPTSGLNLGNYLSGNILSKVTMYLDTPFTDKQQIYSIGYSSDTDFLVKRFKIDKSSVGLFEDFEAGNEIIKKEYKLLYEDTNLFLYPISANTINDLISPDGIGKLYLDIFYDELNFDISNQGFILGGGANNNPVTRVNFANDILEVRQNGSWQYANDNFVSQISPNGKIYNSTSLTQSTTYSYLPNIDTYFNENVTPTFDLDHLTSFKDDGVFYYAGGINAVSAVSNNLEYSYFDNMTFQVSEATLESGLYAAGAAGLHSELEYFIIGGVESNNIIGTSPTTITSGEVAKIQKFDWSNDTISTESYELTYERGFLRCESFESDQLIYAIGGRKGLSYYKNIEIINISNATVSNATDLLYKINGGALLKNNDKLYYCGGELEDSSISNFIQQYDKTTDTVQLGNSWLLFEDKNSGYSYI